MIISSIDAKKAFDKIQHSFMIKSLNTSGIEGMNINTIKAICDKIAIGIMFNCKNLKELSLESGQDKGVYSSTSGIKFWKAYLGQLGKKR
jgi:hypothetical protein